MHDVKLQNVMINEKMNELTVQIHNIKKMIVLNDDIVVIRKKLTLNVNRNRKYMIIILNENNNNKYNRIDNLLLCDVFRYVKNIRENNYNIF